MAKTTSAFNQAADSGQATRSRRGKSQSPCLKKRYCQASEVLSQPGKKGRPVSERIVSVGGGDSALLAKTSRSFRRWEKCIMYVHLYCH
jgi:hypothetical protein